MLLEKSYCESNIVPEDLIVNKLGGNLVEITKNDNVVPFAKEHEGQEETFYKCDKVILRQNISNKNDAIVAFIRLKYSQDDEFSLINKGVQDSTDLEYMAYREYVAWCKEQASVYFDF